MAIKVDTKEQRRVLLDRREALSCMTWAGTGLRKIKIVLLAALAGGPAALGVALAAAASDMLAGGGGGHAAGGSGLGSSTDAFWRF